jgi:outer membrane protein assembly factor BamB
VTALPDAARRLRFGIPASLCIAWLTSAAVVPTSTCRAEDWPGFLGPRGNGVSGETGLLDRWPQAGPPVLWKKKVGEGYSAPSVRGDSLVFFHRVGDEEIVECLDPQTGEPRWRFAYPTTFVDPYGYNGGPRCSPVLDERRCFTFGAEGRLSCVDLATGNELWHRDTRRDFDVPQAFFGVGSTPVLHGEKLLVMIGGHPRAGVVAFDAATGKTLWESVGPADFPDPPVRIQRDRPPVKLASYSSPLVASIHGHDHLLCLMRPGLVSLDPVTGTQRFAVWFRSHLHDSVNAARPVVIDGRIFLSAAYGTGAMLLDVARDGLSSTVAWQDAEAMQTHWSTAIEHKGHLYGFSGRNEPEADLRCIRASDGSLVWRFPDADPGRPAAEDDGRIPFGRGAAILAEDRLIVMGERGTLALVAADSDRFHEISRFQPAEFGHPCWTAPVLSERRLFVTGARQAPGLAGLSTSEYHLVCYDLAAPKQSPPRPTQPQPHGDSR